MMDIRNRLRQIKKHFRNEKLHGTNKNNNRTRYQLKNTPHKPLTNL